MAKYNQWMNDKIYAICNQIPDAQRKEDRKAFFKSIHGTLNHLLFVDRVWMKRFTGKDYSLTKEGEYLYGDFNQLWAWRREIDEDILNWAAVVGEAWLSEQLSFESVMYKKTFTMKRSIAVMQFFNHQTHHRAQITTLLTQMGIDYGPTDLPVMPGI